MVVWLGPKGRPRSQPGSDLTHTRALAWRGARRAEEEGRGGTCPQAATSFPLWDDIARTTNDFETHLYCERFGGSGETTETSDGFTVVCNFDHSENIYKMTELVGITNILPKPEPRSSVSLICRIAHEVCMILRPMYLFIYLFIYLS